jgi:hypothetical protein
MAIRALLEEMGLVTADALVEVVGVGDFVSFYDFLHPIAHISL